MKKFVCDHPWTHFEVNNPNGDVTMCCDNNTVLGNVNTETIEGIWNGERFQTIRRRMRDEGAHAICPHTCPVLHGSKSYQRLDWSEQLDKAGPAHANAALNDEEFAQGKLELKSLPRWMRFAYSYACNLDCYHCYQRDDATQKLKLPDSFMRQIEKHARTFQVIFPFGGEPFLFKPVIDFLDKVDTDTGARYFFITNATLLTDPVIGLLSKRNIGLLAVSLDAATEKSFDSLRRRGRVASWPAVLDNLGKLRALKAQKNFSFTVSMTLNSENFDEIERFVDLGIHYEAEPLIILVSNPYQTYRFQKAYLKFTDQQFDEIFRQIERSLIKLQSIGYNDAVAQLKQLRSTLTQHRRSDNSTTRYMAKMQARRLFRVLPGPVKTRIKKMMVRIPEAGMS